MEPKSLWKEESPSFLHPSTSNRCHSLVFTSQLICFISTLRQRFLTKPREFFLIFKLSMLCYIFIEKLRCTSISPPWSPQHLQKPPHEQSGARSLQGIQYLYPAGQIPPVYHPVACPTSLGLQVPLARDAHGPLSVCCPISTLPWEFQKATGSPDCPEDA